MADVTGPISSLPGSLHKSPKGTMCDDHPDVPATIRVQGETDSFGSEMFDMCDDCYADYKAEQKDWDLSGICDWCKNEAPRLFHRRDFEEGLCGPVYLVCQPCIRKQNQRALEELEAWNDS